MSDQDLIFQGLTAAEVNEALALAWEHDHRRIQPQCPECHGTGWLMLYGNGDPSAPAFSEPANPPVDGEPCGPRVPCLTCGAAK